MKAHCLQNLNLLEDGENNFIHLDQNKGKLWAQNLRPIRFFFLQAEVLHSPCGFQWKTDLWVWPPASAALSQSPAGQSGPCAWRARWWQEPVIAPREMDEYKILWECSLCVILFICNIFLGTSFFSPLVTCMYEMWWESDNVTSLPSPFVLFQTCGRCSSFSRKLKLKAVFQ